MFYIEDRGTRFLRKVVNILPKYSHLLENIEFHVSFAEGKAVPTIVDYRQLLRSDCGKKVWTWFYITIRVDLVQIIYHKYFSC